MKPQKQKFLHDPDNGIFGDCYRTCLAVLLDLERDDVPHFANTMESGEWRDVVQPKFDAWLLGRGFVEVVMAFNCDRDGVLALMKQVNPKVYYMLSGMSRNGTNHVVVCKGDQIVCDTSINESGIIGPCSDGYYWIAFLVPASQTDEAAA